MFKNMSIAVCSTIPDNCLTICDMSTHESMNRLYFAAKQLLGFGEKPSAIAKIINESEQTVSNWQRRGVSKEGALKVQEMTGISANWIRTGKGLMSVNPSAIQKDEISIKKYNVVASMGYGEDQPDHETVLSEIKLSRRWANDNLKGVTSLSNLAAVTGKGDSMRPTFNDGDILIVDTGIREVNADGVYIFSKMNQLYIKRITRKLDGTFEISSDNDTVKSTDIWDGEMPINILGRVRWAWNGQKL